MTDSKELARLRRKACEFAAQIHDIVEERLWQDHGDLPALCQQLLGAIAAVQRYEQGGDSSPAATSD